MLFFVKWKYLLKAARTCARSCTLLEAPTKSRKLCVAGHHDEVQRSELRGQENLVWNIGPIETMELRKPDWSGCTGLYSGEARHESRRAHAHELPGA